MAMWPAEDDSPAAWGPIERAWRRHWHHVALAAWLLLSVLFYAHRGGQSWHYFITGAQSMFCQVRPGIPCGLHLYAQHPDLQIGPLSLMVAAGPTLLGGGFPVARTAMALLGYLVLLLAERGARTASRAEKVRLRRRVLLAGLVFFPAWADLSVAFGHLDDVLALVFTAIAVHSVANGRPRLVGWSLCLAMISKPWAVAFLPLALAAPRGQRIATALRAVVPTLLVMAPFVLADPGTLGASAFRIPNAPASALRVLGVTDATPPWDRPAQFALGILLGVLAVRGRRWQAVVMLAAASRILLDPQVYSYYTAGVLLGALIWDIQVRRGRTVPAWSWTVFAALFACRYLPLPPPVLGDLRLAVCVVIILCALFLLDTLGWFFPARAVATVPAHAGIPQPRTAEDKPRRPGAAPVGRSGDAPPR